MTLKFDGWHWKTIGHLSWAASIYMHHFIIICDSNSSYSPETVKLDCDLCYLDLCPLTLPFCMGLTLVIGNNSRKFHDDIMIGTLSKRCDRRTEGRADNRRTEKTNIHRAAWSQLKSADMCRSTLWYTTQKCKAIRQNRCLKQHCPKDQATGHGTPFVTNAQKIASNWSRPPSTTCWPKMSSSGAGGISNYCGHLVPRNIAFRWSVQSELYLLKRVLHRYWKCIWCL